MYLNICISILCSIEFNTKKVSFSLRFYGPLCSSLTFWVLFSDSVDNDNNYNDDDSDNNINDNNVGDDDMNNNNSSRKYSLSYPEPT